MLFCRAALPLSSRTLTFLAGITGRHQLAAGSRWPKLNPAKQALLALACLRTARAPASDRAKLLAWRSTASTRRSG